MLLYNISYGNNLLFRESQMADSPKTKRRNDALLKSVGENIRHYRKLKGLSLRKLSILTDIEYSQIYKYEAGTVDTNITMLSILALHLDIETFELLVVKKKQTD